MYLQILKIFLESMKLSFSLQDGRSFVSSSKKFYIIEFDLECVRSTVFLNRNTFQQISAVLPLLTILIRNTISTMHS